MHELGRFPGLSVKSFGEADTIGNGLSADQMSPNEEFEERDVVVCQYSKLSGVTEKALAKFRSIVIDCRFPVGFAGSRSPTVVELDNVANEKSKTSKSAPVETTTTFAWWICPGMVMLRFPLR